MLYVGLISGTSADAIDAGLVEIEGDRIQLVDARSVPYPRQLQQRIRRAFFEDPLRPGTISELDLLVGHSFADATGALLQQAQVEPQQVTAIGSHGQTLRHEPDIAQPYSLQVGDGAVIAQRTGITTVIDFRRADIDAGGQGAPLAPALHNALFRSATLDRGILNIGGIANITCLPADPQQPVIGFDTGPGNILLDAWTRRCRDEPFDRGGAWARSGKVHAGLLGALLADPYFKRRAPKSTGFEYFNLDWLAKQINTVASMIPETDVQATLLALTVGSIADALLDLASIEELYVCGGGVHNSALMEDLSGLVSPIPVTSSEALGLHPDWVEATTFAWLAHRRLNNLPGNLPSVTGAQREVVLGVVHKPAEK